MFSVLAALGSRGLAVRPKSPVGDFVEQRALHRSLSSKYQRARWALWYLADREGFEPSNGFHRYTLSRRAPSTTRPPVHGGGNILAGACPQVIWEKGRFRAQRVV